MNKYQIFQINVNQDKPKPKAKIDFEIKTNQYNEYDLNIFFTFYYELDVPEISQIILLEHIVTINCENGVPKFNIDSKYILKNKDLPQIEFDEDREIKDLVGNMEVFKEKIKEYQNAIGELDQNEIGELDQNAIGELDQNAIGELDQNAIGELDQNAIGELDQNVMGELDQNVMGELDQNAIGELDQNAIGELDQNEIGELDQNAIGELDQKSIKNLSEHSIMLNSSTYGDNKYMIDIENSNLYEDDNYSINSSTHSISSTTSSQTIKITSNKIENPISIKQKPVVEARLFELLNSNPKASSRMISGGDETNIQIEQKLYYHLKLITFTMTNLLNNIVYIITELMKFIDNYKIKGDDKKNMIISVLKQFLIDENYKQENILYIIDVIVPELIDILISVDKRRIIIKKKMSCFPFFCS